MREILFRGKRVSDGQWVTGSYIRANMHWHENGIHEDWISPMVFANGGYMNVAQRYAVKGETVDQYTGLTDKNGKKIFEDDLVEYEHGFGVIKFGVQQSPCDSSMPVGFYINWLCDRGYRSDLFYWASKVSVVGNIHDNPELIGGDC